MGGAPPRLSFLRVLAVLRWVRAGPESAVVVPGAAAALCRSSEEVSAP